MSISYELYERSNNTNDGNFKVFIHNPTIHKYDKSKKEIGTDTNEEKNFNSPNREDNSGNQA
ncbi:MAG: hypothetical protein AAF693_03620, partial [Bacteroidota bacterium]